MSLRCLYPVFASFFGCFCLKKMSAGNSSLADSYQTDVWEVFCFLLQLLYLKSFRENVKELLTTFLNLLKCFHAFKSPLKWMLNGFNWNKMYGLSPLLCSWESCSRCVCVSCYQAKPSFCKHKDSFICAPVEFCPSTVDKNTDNLCLTSREKVLLVKE